MKAEVRFFHCGNGDTILIRGEDEWALVDANLTIQSGARERLEKTLKKYKIRQLRFVCVTHFDADHIRGLGRFLRDHFGPNGKERKEWQIEQMIIPFRTSGPFWEALFCTDEHYRKILGEMDDATIPFTELFDAMREMAQQDHTIFRSYDPRTRLVSRTLIPTAAPFGPWDVWFLGPSVEMESRYMHNCSTSWGLANAPTSEWPKLLRRAVERNESSRIIALYHRTTQDVVLLTGDGTSSSIEEALQQWRNVKHQMQISDHLPFRLIKASHHGAWTDRDTDNCHHEPTYTIHSLPTRSHVVISCGDFDAKHPHMNMIGCLHKAGLKSVSTGLPHDSVAGRSSGKRRPEGVPIGYPRQLASASDVTYNFCAGRLKVRGGHPRTQISLRKK